LYGYSISTDGRCGPKTISTIKKFQKAIGVKVDGRFGKKTLEKAKKIKK
jgi:peptidoglycan hydrolase-like protein with peptidoglycan-binding domain